MVFTLLWWITYRPARPWNINQGAASILNCLFFLLGEATGDACLIPAPYYAAFENDMNLVSGVVPFPIQQFNPVAGPTETELSDAYVAARAVSWFGVGAVSRSLLNPSCS